MKHRRCVVTAVSDAVLSYWVTGTDDEFLCEWWTTDDAVDTANELATVMLQAIRERGYKVVKA